MMTMELINAISGHSDNVVYIKHKGKYYAIKQVTEESTERLRDTYMTILEIKDEAEG